MHHHDSFVPGPSAGTVPRQRGFQAFARNSGGFALFAAAALVGAGLLACAGAAPASPRAAARTAAPALAEKQPQDPAVRSGVLPNGLKYYVMANKQPAGRAYLRLFVDAGSVLETDDERGLAHFVEHMAFNGSANFPKDALIDYLRSLGMRFGPEVNAYTSFDETVFGIEVPTEAIPGAAADAARRVPDKALAVLEDWTHTVAFDPKAVDEERNVIMEELRMGKGAQDRVRRIIWPALLAGSTYADRLPIGLPEIVAGAPAERIAGFYKKWYRPDNMAVVIVGDFDAAALEAGLAARFGAPKPAAALDRPRPELPAPKPGSLRVVTATDPELPYGAVRLYFKRAPEKAGADLAAFRGDLIENLIQSMVQQRFEDATSKPETPYAAAGASFQRYGRESRFFSLGAVPKAGAAEASLKALLLEQERLARYGFSASELKRAEADLLSSLKNAAAEKDKRESEGLAQDLGDGFIAGVPVPAPDWQFDAAQRLLPGIGAADLEAAVRGLFSGDDLTVLLSANDQEAATLPSEDRVRLLVGEAAAAVLDRPAEELSDAKLLAADPVPGKIVSETKDAASGALVWTLSNGARVILDSTKNRNDQIVLSAMARGGKTGAAAADYVSAEMASALAQASGIGPYGLPELSKKLAGKQVSLSFSAGFYTRSFNGSAGVEDLPVLFQLLHLAFVQPRIDDGAAKSHLEGVKATLLRKKDNPEALFGDAVTRTVTGGNPRFEPLSAERLDQVSLDASRRLLASWLTPGDFTFVFAGNADPAVLKPLAERYLASLPGTRSGASWTDPEIKRPAGAAVALEKGKEDKGLGYEARFAASPFSRKSSAVAAALQEYLDIRLTDELRQKRGDVYSISVGAFQSKAPREELSLSVSFSAAPGKLDNILQAVDAELAALRDQGPDAAVLAKAKEALGKEFESSLQENSFLAYNLAYCDVLSREAPGAFLSAPASYAALAGEDLKAAAALLTASAPLKVTLGPEKK